MEKVGLSTHSFYYPRANTRDVSLDNLMAGGAEDQGTAWVDRRKKRIALFKPVTEVRKRLSEFFDKPIELVFLFGPRKQQVNQHPGRRDFCSHVRTLLIKKAR